MFQRQAMNFATNLIRKLPPVGEFLLIVSLCFSGFITNSFLWRVSVSDQKSSAPSQNSSETGKPNYVFTSRSHIILFFQELIQLALAAWILKIRGWSRSDFNLKASWILTGQGLLLYFLYYGIYCFNYNVLSSFLGAPEASSFYVYSRSEGNFLCELLVVLINPVYEEVFLVGYVLKALQKYGAFLAISTSVLIRLSYHTYQGVEAVHIAILGTLFACAYWHQRELWPLIFAHALLDLPVAVR